MAQIANIVINDSAAVAHTFVPIGLPNGVVTWADQTTGGGVVAGWWKITATVRPATATQSQKIDLRVYMPTLLSPVPASGIPAVAYQEMGVMTFTVSPASTPLERKNLRSLASNLLGNPQVIDMIENMATPF